MLRCSVAPSEITSGRFGVFMKKQTDQPTEKQKLEEAQQQLSSEEKQGLLAALDTARETVRPTVKRLMESESITNEILTIRLDKASLSRSGHATYIA